MSNALRPSELLIATDSCGSASEEVEEPLLQPKPGSKDVPKKTCFGSLTAGRKLLFGSVLLCVAVLLCIVLASLVVELSTPAKLRCPSMHVNGSREQPDVVFFVVGDWGREGIRPQRQVSKVMGRLAEQCYGGDISFVVSTGDNFYPHGLRSLSDPLFVESFKNVYSSDGLQVPWFAVLGNHDYHGYGPKVEGEYSPQWQVTGGNAVEARSTLAVRDPRWNCRQGAWRASFASQLLDIIFIDTTPLSRAYGSDNSSDAAGLGDAMQQVEVIRDLLHTSTARFKFVVGHHPRYSHGKHCKYHENSGTCAKMFFLEPILTEFKVDAYFAGHDHNLQFLKRNQGNNPALPPVFYVVSGAGSSIHRGALDKAPYRLLKGDDTWMHEAPGFTAVSLKGDSMTIDFWDAHHSSRLMSVSKRASSK